MRPLKSIVEWNTKYPLDRWWREKYNVSFGSDRHLDQSQYDIYIEFVEHIIYDKILTAEREDESPYIPGTGNIFKQKAINYDEITSLDDLQFDENGNIISIRQ